MASITKIKHSSYPSKHINPLRIHDIQLLTLFRNSTLFSFHVCRIHLGDLKRRQHLAAFPAVEKYHRLNAHQPYLSVTHTVHKIHHGSRSSLRSESFKEQTHVSPTPYPTFLNAANQIAASAHHWPLTNRGESLSRSGKNLHAHTHPRASITSPPPP